MVGRSSCRSRAYEILLGCLLAGASLYSDNKGTLSLKNSNSWLGVINNQEENDAATRNFNDSVTISQMDDLEEAEAAAAAEEELEDEPILEGEDLFKEEDVEDDIHNSSIAVLPLLDWEIRTLEKPYKSSCNVPKGIDDKCCLGLHSREGKIESHRRYLCDHLTLGDYQNLQQVTEGYLLSTTATTATTTTNTKSSCDLCRIVELLRRNRSLSFATFGDSVSFQQNQGLVCELQRRNYLVRRETIPPWNKGDGYRNFRKIERQHIRSPLWPAEETDVVIDFVFQYRLPFLFADEREFVLTRYDILVMNLGLHWVYQPDPNNKFEQRYTPKTLPKLLGEFFQQIKQSSSKIKLLAFRESTASHFDGDAGDFSIARLKPTWPTNMTCVARYDNVGIDGWREPLVIQAAQDANFTIINTSTITTTTAASWGNNNHYNTPQQQLKTRTASNTATTHNNSKSTTILATSNTTTTGGNDKDEALPSSRRPFNEIYMIPLYEFSKPLYNFHPRREKGQHWVDCIHFCHNTFLYQPVWKGVRLAMEHYLLQH